MGNCYSDMDGHPEESFLDERVYRELNLNSCTVNFDADMKIRSNAEVMEGLKTIRELGRGLFSRVFLVGNEKGEQLALKVVKKKDFKTPSTIKKIVIEREILKILDHPNILKLYRTVQSDSRIFYFIEYASKGSLLDLLNSKGRMRLDDIRFVTAQIIEALLYIHSKGLIYGDLKAENILLSSEGVIKLCDFNLSGTQSILQGTFQGTLSYFAPEIVQGKFRTRMSDFWALGVLVYLMAYHRFPFKAMTQGELFHNIINVNVQAEPWRIQQPKELKMLIHGLLCKNVSKRLGRTLECFKKHPFFEGFDWKEYRTKELPFKYIEGVPDTESTPQDEPLLDSRETSDFPHIPESLGTRPIYNILGFTYDHSHRKPSERSDHEIEPQISFSNQNDRISEERDEDESCETYKESNGMNFSGLGVSQSDKKKPKKEKSEQEFSLKSSSNIQPQNSPSPENTVS